MHKISHRRGCPCSVEACDAICCFAQVLGSSSPVLSYLDADIRKGKFCKQTFVLYQQRKHCDLTYESSEENAKYKLAYSRYPTSVCAYHKVLASSSVNNCLHSDNYPQSKQPWKCLSLAAHMRKKVCKRILDLDWKTNSHFKNKNFASN